MPIRHCQKCSLKVLIDENQASVSPFYCQRCTVAIKSDSTAGSAATPARRASSPSLTPVPALSAVAVAAPPSAGAKTTVKVFCPYCKASFNGKTPAKPARGSCPLCQKDLILLPTGDIRPAADFDLAKWQAEQDAGGGDEKESGTMVLVKKFAAKPQTTAADAESGKKILEEKAEALPPAPAEETQVPDEGVELPAWLDEGEKKPAPKISLPVTAPADTDQAEPVRLEDLDPPTAAPPPPPPPRRTLPPKPTASAPPIPPKPPAPAAVTAVAAPKKATHRREKTARREAEAVEVGATSGTGKFILSLLLTMLPVAACPILLSTRAKLEDVFLKDLGARFGAGFRELDGKLFPEPAAPAPAPAPKPPAPEPEAPLRPTADDQRQLEEEINKRWIEYKREERTVRQKSVGATPAEKAEFQKVEMELKEKLGHIDQLKANYRKLFGKDYDPTKQ